jgi:hypothetical protein
MPRVEVEREFEGRNTVTSWLPTYTGVGDLVF